MFYDNFNIKYVTHKKGGHLDGTNVALLVAY